MLTTAHARTFVLCLVVYGIALWARWSGLPIATMLGDSMGPWWTGLYLPTQWSGHSPIYGWASGVPHALLLLVIHDLEQGVRGLLALHALAAPIAALIVLALRPKAWLSASLAGLLTALDPGLIETALSGHKTYFAPLWIALLTLSVAHRKSGWAGLLAGLSLAFAIQNHLLAVAAAPLCLLLDWKQNTTRLGALVCALLMLPFAAQLLSQPMTTDGGVGFGWMNALPAFLIQGGGTAGLVLILPAIVSFLPVDGLHAQNAPETRAIARCTLTGLIILFLVGLSIGYLRDHHLRLMTVPALCCLAHFCTRWIALSLLALRPPSPDLPLPDHPQRPGTLGLTTQVTEALPNVPLLVDGVWLSSTPAAEPSAVMLDWSLRTHGAIPIDPNGELVLIVSGERVDLLPYRRSPHLLQSGDRHVLIMGTTADLSAEVRTLCQQQPRLGGVNDVLGPLRPDLSDEQIRAWQTPCTDG